MKSIYTIIITMYSMHTISEFFLGGMLKNLKEGGCAPSLQNLPLYLTLIKVMSLPQLDLSRVNDFTWTQLLCVSSNTGNLKVSIRVWLMELQVE